MNSYYVYEYYINDTNEVFYVGKGRGRRYKDTSNRNKFFKDMYNTHTCSVRKVFSNLSEIDAFKKEVDLIDYYRNNTDYRLTNQTDGGEGTSGFELSEETKLKISRSNKLKWKDEEFRNKQLLHRKHGVYKSEEFKERMSEVTKGENNGNYKNYWTEEQKEYLSRLRISNGKSKGVKNGRAKKIMSIETGVIYDYIRQAMLEHNIDNQSLFTLALNNKERTAGGLHWVYINNSNKSYFSNEENRRKYLIEALLLKKNSKPMICIETEEIYYSKSDLANKIDTTVSKISYQLKHNNYFIKNNNKYILLSDYNSRIQQ